MLGQLKDIDIGEDYASFWRASQEVAPVQDQTGNWLDARDAGWRDAWWADAQLKYRQLPL